MRQKISANRPTNRIDRPRIRSTFQRERAQNLPRLSAGRDGEVEPEDGGLVVVRASRLHRLCNRGCSARPEVPTQCRRDARTTKEKRRGSLRKPEQPLA